MGKQLERLSFNQGRVFDVERMAPDVFLITDACGNHFSVSFTAAELIELADEIRALALLAEERG